MANKIIYVDENISRLEEAEYFASLTREEWEDMEREYVGEKPEPDGNRKLCACWDCTTLFVPKRSNQKYCSERCSKEQNSANGRIKKSGTYLPKKAYGSLREESKEKRWKLREKPKEYIKDRPLEPRFVPARGKSRKATDEMYYRSKVTLPERSDNDPFKTGKGPCVYTVNIKTGEKTIFNEKIYKKYYVFSDNPQKFSSYSEKGIEYHRGVLDIQT